MHALNEIAIFSKWLLLYLVITPSLFLFAPSYSRDTFTFEGVRNLDWEPPRTSSNGSACGMGEDIFYPNLYLLLRRAQITVTTWTFETSAGSQVQERRRYHSGRFGRQSGSRP